MIVLLEGPDGGGKTTLAKQLEAFGFGYVHMSAPEPADQPLDYWFARLGHVCRPTVVDRMHWSEDVYGSLFRGGSALSDRDRWMLEGWLIAHGTVVVLCMPSLETILENMARDPDGMHHDPEMARRVYEMYNWPWSTELPVIKYDFTEEKIAHFLERLWRVQLKYDLGSDEAREAKGQ